MRNSTLSPKELAQATGVSESSVKRWVDSGVIQASRTAGGHRRISLGEAVRYVRDTGIDLTRPEFLGLPTLGAVIGTGEVEARFLDALRDGLAQEARSIILSQFMAGTSISALCDGPVRTALDAIGEEWQHSESGVFVEHRATDVCLEIVRELRALFEISPSAPQAVGGAIAGDWYSLTSLCASAVLAENGIRTQNLGANTPLSAFRAAVESLSPDFVWLSINHIGPELESPLEWRSFVASLEVRSTTLLIGGRRMGEFEILPSRQVFKGTNFSELTAFLRGRQLLG